VLQNPVRLLSMIGPSTFLYSLQQKKEAALAVHLKIQLNLIILGVVTDLSQICQIPEINRADDSMGLRVSGRPQLFPKGLKIGVPVDRCEQQSPRLRPSSARAPGF